ncbi:MAG TPA: trimeric intracellular cation channel family protein [Thermoflexales bacterium]|nr:trimeric intracellular cation channel family protein [Thermoflexales bacterium]
MDLSPLISLIEALGIGAFALSGVVEAKKKGMDFVGAFTAAFLTAFGGGTLRDLILDRHPLVWIGQPTYIAAVFLIALIASVRHALNGQLYAPGRLVDILDALGLGLFSAAGTSVALTSGAHPLVAIVMGVVTATFGGVLRDVICNEIPSIFRTSQLYATCALLGSIVYLLLRVTALGEAGASAAAIAAVAGLRLLALRHDIVLPF